MLRTHHICDDCAQGRKGVFKLEVVVWGNCCWCGDSTGSGLYKEAEDAPCEDTCVSEWLRLAIPEKS